MTDMNSILVAQPISTMKGTNYDMSSNKKWPSLQSTKSAENSINTAMLGIDDTNKGQTIRMHLIRQLASSGRKDPLWQNNIHSCIW